MYVQERMSLASPSVNAEPTSSSSSSRHSTGTLESDGYSDVFDIELDEVCTQTHVHMQRMNKIYTQHAAVHVST